MFSGAAVIAGTTTVGRARAGIGAAIDGIADMAGAADMAGTAGAADTAAVQRSVVAVVVAGELAVGAVAVAGAVELASAAAAVAVAVELAFAAAAAVAARVAADTAEKSDALLNV